MTKKEIIDLLANYSDDDNVFMCMGDGEKLFFGTIIAVTKPLDRIIIAGSVHDTTTQETPTDKEVIFS